MHLHPIIRSSRAISACLIYPQDPLTAISVSETISLIGPLFNPNFYSKIASLTAVFMYCPKLSYYLLENFNKIKNLYYEAEICTSLLFILCFSLHYLK